MDGDLSFGDQIKAQVRDYCNSLFFEIPNKVE